VIVEKVDGRREMAMMMVNKGGFVVISFESRRQIENPQPSTSTLS
jgi:hypothetical protein